MVPRLFRLKFVMNRQIVPTQFWALALFGNLTIPPNYSFPQQTNACQFAELMYLSGQRRVVHETKDPSAPLDRSRFFAR